MTTTVVNATKRGGKRPEFDAYTGRGPCPCEQRVCPHGGGLGNPFDRDLIAFLDYAVERIRTQPGYRAAVSELRGKRLACWCVDVTPARGRRPQCHAEVLARLAEGEDPSTIRADLEG